MQVLPLSWGPWGTTYVEANVCLGERGVVAAWLRTLSSLLCKPLYALFKRKFESSANTNIQMICRWYTAHYNQRIQHLGWLNKIYSLAIWYMKQFHCQFFCSWFFPLQKAKCKGCTHSVSVSIAPCIFGCCLLWSPMRRSCTLHSAFLWCMDLKSQGRGGRFFHGFFFVYLESILRSKMGWWFVTLFPV